VPPVGVDHVAFLPGVQLDEIAGLELARGKDMDPGEQVGQRVLQRESDREAADAERGQQRGDRHAEAVEQDQEADREHDDPGDVDEDRGRAGKARVLKRPGPDRAGGGPRRAESRGQHDQRQQSLVRVTTPLAAGGGQAEHGRPCAGDEGRPGQQVGEHAGDDVTPPVSGGPGGNAAQRQAQRDRGEQASGPRGNRDHYMHARVADHRSPSWSLDPARPRAAREHGRRARAGPDWPIYRRISTANGCSGTPRCGELRARSGDRRAARGPRGKPAARCLAPRIDRPGDIRIQCAMRTTF
jgi:hypothetical protein